MGNFHSARKRHRHPDPDPFPDPDAVPELMEDAVEFFLRIINSLEPNRKHLSHGGNPANVFRFKVKDKVQCDESKCVRYSHRMEYCLPFPIPLDAAINKEEVTEYERKKAEVEGGEIIRPKIPFEACIEAFLARETFGSFNTATKRIGTASKFTRLATFPAYLAIQLKKFVIAEDDDGGWSSRKLDVSVDMPLELDISALKARGIRPGEVEFPDEDERTRTDPAPAIQPAKVAFDVDVDIDETAVLQLMEMGFHPNVCRRALISSGNAGVEMAINWIMEHMDDLDLDLSVLDEVSKTVQGVGNRSAKQAWSEALQTTDNNVGRAIIDMIFSHIVDDSNSNVNNLRDAAAAAEAEVGAEAGAEHRGSIHEEKTKTGVKTPGKYKLMGFVSHIGPSTVGRYFAHIWKDNRWVLIKDRPVGVADSEVPMDLGYLYFYKRC